MPASISSPSKTTRAAIASLALASSILIVALLRVGYLLHGFYLDTASLPPGTPIRPMGLALQLCLATFGSIFIGGLCATIGASLALAQCRWRLAFIAGLVFILTWLPLALAAWGEHSIVSMRQLVMED